MSGTAKTTKFLLGSATVMVGPQADVFNFQPATHGLGLVKNFSASADVEYTELTQGTSNDPVYSVLTKLNARAQMEVYEYTAKNLSYALGLDGSSVVAQTVATTTTADVDGDDTPTGIVPVTSVTGLSANDYVMIATGSEDDQVICRQISDIDTLNLTVAPDVGVLVPSGSAVKKVNKIDVGSPDAQPFLAAKIVGNLADGSQAVLIYPKIRISKGFTLEFKTDAYGNLPFEFTMYALASDEPNYSEFGKKRGRLYIQK